MASKYARDAENAARAEQAAKQKARLDALKKHAESPAGLEEVRQRSAREAAESKARSERIAKNDYPKPPPRQPRGIGGGTRAALDRIGSEKDAAAKAAEQARQAESVAQRSRISKAVRSATRGAGKAMGIAGFTLPKESVKKALKESADVYESKAVKRSGVRGSRKGSA